MRYKLSYRDVAEFFLLRGFQFTHETVRDWEERFLPQFIDQIRTKRRGKVAQVWHIDETYIRVNGAWCYLYRGIDEDGNLIDVRLSATRDMYMTEVVALSELRKRFLTGVGELETLFYAS